MNKNKINIFFSTLNFVLCFVGYQLATSLFLPVSSNIDGINRLVTVPYRAFALLISIIVIALNFLKPIGKTPLALKILFLYWAALIIRMFYDIYLRTDVYITETTQLWLYVFGICLSAMISVLKSYRYIDLNKAMWWILYGVAATLILSLFSNEAFLVAASEATERVNANLGLNTISLGHLGGTGVILAVFIFQKKHLSFGKKTLISLFILLCLFIILRAGSRGPIFALIIVALFGLFAKNKHVLLGLGVVFITILLSFIFIEQILDFVGNISPVMETRLRLTIYEGDTGEREPLYQYAWQAFLEKPFLGKQFAIFESHGDFIYPHNIILDALMGLGIFGGLSMIYLIVIAIKNSYQLVKSDSQYLLFALFLIQQIMYNMTSGAIYYNQLLNVLLVYIFMRGNEFRYKLHTNNKLYEK